MAKLGRRKSVDRATAEKYRRVGSALLDSAQALATIADDDDQFGNAIAIVAIHGAIAYADSLSISYGGFKSTDGDHTRAADVVQEAMGSRADERALKALRSALSAKDTVSYSGTYYRLADARASSTTPPGSAHGPRRRTTGESDRTPHARTEGMPRPAFG